MRKTRFIVAALVLLLALSLSGLVSAQQATPAAGPEATMESAAMSGQTTIRLEVGSSGTQEDAALEAQIAAFEAANPDIFVQLTISPDENTTMQTAFASGDYPEVFYVGQDKLGDWASAGVLASAEGKLDDQSDFYPSLLKVFTYNGTLMCPPKDFSTLGLEYNKDMFDAAGLSYPTADWTWTDLQNAAQKLTTSSVHGLSLNPDKDRWFAFYFGAGGSLYDSSGNFQFQTQPALDAINYYAGLHSSGYSATSQETGAGWPGEAFGKGQAAMTIEGNWIIQYLLDTFPNLKWGVTEVPKGANGTQATLAFTVCYGVAADNKYPDQSWKLVNFLTGKDQELAEAQHGFGVMPSRQSAADAWLQARGSDYDAFVKGAAYASVDIVPTGFSDFNNVVNTDLQNVFSGSMTAQEAVDDISKTAQDLSSQMATATPQS